MVNCTEIAAGGANTLSSGKKSGWIHDMLCGGSQTALLKVLIDGMFDIIGVGF
jgi:hypothetical protein